VGAKLTNQLFVVVMADQIKWPIITQY